MNWRFLLVGLFLHIESTDGDSTEVTGVTTSQTTSTPIAGAPYFTEPPFNATVLVDKTFLLTCQMRGDPKPKITWFHYYDRLKKHGTFHSIRKNGNLRFSRIMPDHEGYYRCIGKNDKGTNTSNLAFLKVHAPAVIADGMNNKQVSEGDTVQLKCIVFGIPTPEVTWSVNNHTLVDPETKKAYNKSSYRFNATETSVFTCTASNHHIEGYTTVSKSATVVVKHKPQGTCQPYTGMICRHHLGSRGVWYNLGVPANHSTVLEHVVLGVWKRLVSSVSDTCRPVAEALLCEAVLPACENITDLPVPVPLCREHCDVIQNHFCFQEWNNIVSQLSRSNISLPNCSILPHSQSNQLLSHSNTSVTSGNQPLPSNLPSQHASCSHVKLFTVDPSHSTSTCYEGNGRLYEGDVSETEGMYPCQSWADHHPHPHPYITPTTFPILLNAGNSCRNPGGLKARPWCYINTTGASSKWQYCNVTQCESNTTSGRYGYSRESMKDFFTTQTIVIVVTVSLVAVSLIVLIALLCYRMCQQRLKIQYNRASQCDIDIDIEKLQPNDLYHQEFGGLDVNPALDKVEYPRNDIVFVRDIGRAAFGRVFQAKAPNIGKNQDFSTIVVKMLKEDASEDMQLDFEREASLLLELDHPNIIKLLGACAIGKPMCLLFEYMGKGDLNQFLRNCCAEHYIVRNRSTEIISSDVPKLDHAEQLSIAEQIASAMVYLSERGYIHRDLATRNCLVGDCSEWPGLTVKISDFGLAHRLQNSPEDIYIGSDQDAIPVRWMPLEAIVYNHFSVDSDVWSFGVVLWEIFSFAAQPYNDMDHEEVIKFLGDGYTLPCPDNTPEEIYDLMVTCWELQPSDRPTFHTVHEQICEILDELPRRTERV